MSGLQKDLVFDIGMHMGEDADFYLRKQFRVVGVEAVPWLAEASRRRLGAAVDEGRLEIVNSAITAVPGPVDFFVSDNSVWGTTSTAWRDRNARLGVASVQKLTADGITCDQLFETYGVPYYMKIDIEGADLLCLEALKSQVERCEFVSIESDKVSWARLQAEFQLLTDLGYRRFKIVPQHKVARQRSPHPPREGAFVAEPFVAGQSGLFGEEAPGRWLTRRQALRRYRLIFLRYRLLGDDGLLSHGPLRKVAGALGRIGIGAGWFDTHAGR